MMWVAKIDSYIYFFVFFLKQSEELAPVAHLYQSSMQQLQVNANPFCKD